MIMPNIPIPPKCPKCGGANIRSKWSLTTIVAWVGKLLGVSAVKIFDKRCGDCGEEFQVFRK